MSYSLSHGRQQDVGRVGVAGDQLPPFDDGPIDLRRWFDASAIDRPLEMEIGCGKGTFLVQQAALTPQVNYVALEYAAAFWRYAADRCRRRQLENVRIVRAEAQLFVRNYAPDDCFQRVHIYFPDPWPKKRHHKRRLIQAPFLQQLHRVLTPRGLVCIATDHADYFQWICQHCAQATAAFEQLPFVRPDSAGEDEWVGTNFERKYRRQGRPFHGLLLQKR